MEQTTTLQPGVSLEVEKGQAVYSKAVLAIYDLWVLGISNRFIWRCPTPEMLAQFNAYATNNHLDVGVGTGYYLDKCQFPDGPVRLGLMDLNRNSLDVTAERVRRYDPLKYQLNVLEPIDLDVKPYDSISVNYLFHCLPGGLAEKLVVFEHLDPLLADGGCIFGSTLLQGGVERNWAARRLMKVYNEKGIFSNTADDLQTLRDYLAANYAEFAVMVVGAAVLFYARKARKAA